MFFIACAIFVLTVFMTMSAMTLAVVPGLCYTVYQVTVVLFDILTAAIIFYWNVMHIAFDVISGILGPLRPLVVHVAPVVYFYVREMFETTRGVFNLIWRNFNDTIVHGEQGLMVMWGALVASIYIYWNQVIEAFEANQVNGAHGDVDTGENTHGRQTGNRIHTGNRLYPDLSNIDDNEYTLNDSESINRENSVQEHIGNDNNHNGMGRRNLFSQQKMWQFSEGMENKNCVICFERERDTAIFPCGHTHTCLQCTLAIKKRNNLCPICQQNIGEHKRVFV